LLSVGFTLLLATMPLLVANVIDCSHVVACCHVIACSFITWNFLNIILQEKNLNFIIWMWIMSSCQTSKRPSSLIFCEISWLYFGPLFSVKFLRNFTVLWWVAKIQTNQSVIHSVNLQRGLQYMFLVVLSALKVI
jgi:hypothetical protein